MCAFVILESTLYFKSTKYEVEEKDGGVEFTIALTEAVPFNASLELRTIDDTTKSEVYVYEFLRSVCTYIRVPYNL